MASANFYLYEVAPILSVGDKNFSCYFQLFDQPIEIEHYHDVTILPLFKMATMTNACKSAKRWIFKMEELLINEIKPKKLIWGLKNN